jgi:hypothetical protein
MKRNVGFEVLTAVSMKMAIALMMEAARTSETLVNFYQTTRCYNPEEAIFETKCDYYYLLYFVLHRNPIAFLKFSA